MKKKYIVILIPILIVIIGLILILKPKKQSINNMELTNEDIEEVNYIYKAIENRELESGWEYMERYQGPMIKGILENRIDVWNDKVFTKDFLKKYKNGYWDNSDILSIYDPQGDEYNTEFCFTQEQESEKNMFIIKNDGGYVYLFSLEFSDDFKIKDLICKKSKKVLDENGLRLNNKDKGDLKGEFLTYRIAAITFPSYYNKLQNFPNLKVRDYFNLSDSFLNKYGYDDDIIKHNFEIDYIEENEDESNAENNVVVTIYNYNENIKETYELHFELDDNDYLKDITYKKIS